MSQITRKFRPRAKDLTPQRYAVLQALGRYEREFGHPPTLRELKQRLGMRSPASVLLHLESLERQQLVHHKPGVTRGWRVSSLSLNFCGWEELDWQNHSLMLLEGAEELVSAMVLEGIKEGLSLGA